eukprot:8214304-Pyramimonas_sp.AAC.1
MESAANFNNAQIRMVGGLLRVTLDHFGFHQAKRRFSLSFAVAGGGAAGGVLRVAVLHREAPSQRGDRRPARPLPFSGDPHNCTVPYRTVLYCRLLKRCTVGSPLQTSQGDNAGSVFRIRDE